MSKLIVVSGPSGVGKSTVLKKVMERRSNICFSVSATTRPIRPGEIDGKHYFFLNREQFQDMIDQDLLLEYAEYVGNFYGTPEHAVNDALSNGNDVIMDIEVQGAVNVKKKRQDAALIFLAAPSFEELERRLTQRGDTSLELCKSRLERARYEYSQAHLYDYIVVNDDVDTAANEILSIIAAEKCKTKERIYIIEEVG